MSVSFRRRGLAVLFSLSVAACGGGGGGAKEAGIRHSVSGAVAVAGNTAADSDLNDPAAPYSPNDDFITAQRLDAPGLLGGYLNLVGAGPAGRSFEAGDPVDVYSMTLAAGMRVELAAASPDADLDLYLYAASDTLTPVDSSVGPGPQESLEVKANGDYYLVVEAVSGASVYTLAIDRATGPAPASLRLSDEFVPGEALVRLHKPAGRFSAAAAPAADLGLAITAGGDGREARATLTRPPAGPVHRSDWRIAARAAFAAPDPAVREKLDTLLAIKALRRQPQVELAEPNYLRRPLAVPNDTYYHLQWNLGQLNLPIAWDYTHGVRPIEPVRVAVLDTGVIADHPDLHGVLLPGYDFVSDPARAADGDGIDPDPDDPRDRASGGSTFHGTHVAGIIAARGDNGLGVAGVSWGARLLPVRVLGVGGGTSYDIMQGLRYAAGMSNDSGERPERPAEIINLSLGGGAPSELERELLRQVRGRGIIVVGAAGNDGLRAPFYPAAYEGVVGVSGLDLRHEPARYSNRGAHVDLAAPGGDLEVDLDGNGDVDGVLSVGAKERDGGLWVHYFYANGTSMAAAHVSGVLALMKAIAPGLDPDGFDSLLAAGRLTLDLGPPGWDERTGHGLLDAHRAVLAALDGGSVPHAALVLDPVRLDFGSDARSLPLRVDATGRGLELVHVGVSASWLTLEPTRVNADGLGDYTLVVDRSALVPGSYQTRVSFRSNAGETELPVTLEVAEVIRPGHAGRLYVLLVDAASGKTVAQAAPRDGGFRFEGVGPGRYFIVAGTDADNDGRVCGPGEACGAWPGLAAPRALPPEELGGRELVVEFPRPPEVRGAALPAAGFERLR